MPSNVKEPTKAIAWLSVPEKTKQHLINIQTHLLSNSLTIPEEMQARWEFTSNIHQHLGTKEGFFNDFTERLEEFAKDGKGGVFADIHEYIGKFKTIEKAAIQVANQEISNLSHDNQKLPTKGR